MERVNGDNKMFAIVCYSMEGEWWPSRQDPRRKGFGSTILVDAAKKFGKDAKLCFDQEGLSYELRVPLNTIEAAQAMPTRRA